MNINLKFVLFCARKCLILWDAPKEVHVWLSDPTNLEKAKEAQRKSWAIADVAARKVGWENAALSAQVAAWAARAVEWGAPDVPAIQAARLAAKKLGMPIAKLKFMFVSTLNDDELSTTDPEWIDYVTVEIFNR